MLISTLDIFTASNICLGLYKYDWRIQEKYDNLYIKSAMMNKNYLDPIILGESFSVLFYSNVYMFQTLFEHK